MDIPYFAILIIYLVVVGIFLLMAYFNIYHIVKWSLFDARSKTIVFLFIALSVVILFMSFFLLRGIDWWYPLFTIPI